jgi:hypothetical protein
LNIDVFVNYWQAGHRSIFYITVHYGEFFINSTIFRTQILSFLRSY